MMTLTKNLSGLERMRQWFAALGRKPLPFQQATWDAYLQGQSGLVQAPTGMGKTLAAALGPAIEFLDSEHSDPKKTAPITIVWITPLRALAADLVHSLQQAITGLNLNWTVEMRTSDTTQTVRKRQKERLPTILVTTPESMSLLLSYVDSSHKFASLRCVVVDEWHDLMSSKRGVQVELALARLKTFAPDLRVWGLSATIRNRSDALDALLGPIESKNAAIIEADDHKPIILNSLLPKTMEKFPWAGHLGKQMVGAVVDSIESSRSSLVFTNTRSQTELWFAALMNARPDWLGKLAVHHGSLDRKLRHSVQQMLRDGQLKAVVCTSSLDLGVDFWPVDRVIQIGSPKSIARTMQRAGRSGHRPGEASEIVCVPTQAFEVLEFSAARRAIAQRDIEPRELVLLPLDVLAQHVVTVAAGGGFVEQELLQEVRTTRAFAEMTDQQWRWVMDFAQRGGPTLTAYPHFSRIKNENGRWICGSDQIARMHRMNVGTITADGAVAVQFVGGKRLGSVEESFASKLKAGDRFTFAGRTLEFVRLHDMTAHVRTARSKSGTVPRWMGGKLPLSASLAESVRHRLDEAADEIYVDAEMQHVRPILEIQKRWSIIPRKGNLLIESIKSREGHHQYLFAFQGRLVHEGLAALLTYRLGNQQQIPITATFNDYGVELLSPQILVETNEQWLAALSPENLVEDILACMNSGELARRHFREIARIAGLLIATRPGGSRSTRQLQASSELFFDVFREFDPQNLLLEQARREVLEKQLEIARLRNALGKIGGEQIVMVSPAKMSPLAFPLWAERIASMQLRLESSRDRIARLAEQLERAAMAE